MKQLEFKIVGKELQTLTDADARLGQLIRLIGDYTLELRESYFAALVRAIIGQQLSVKAAATICCRAEQLCGEFTPEAIMSVSEEQLRNVGFSKAKAAYVQHLAEKVLAKEIDLQSLQTLDDQTALTELMKLKGIGKWTAEMFLIFSLGRLNILSLGDAGLQRAVKWLYNLDKDSKEDHLEAYGGHWHPYQSVASLYLWEAINLGYVDQPENRLPESP